MSRLRARIAVASALAVLAAYSRNALAGGGASTDAYDGIAPDAAVDVHAEEGIYAETNLADPRSQTTPYRAFDAPAGRPAVSFLGLTLAHTPDVLGFRVDAIAGNVRNAFLAYDPERAAQPEVAGALSFVEQAFVSVAPKLPRPVVFDVGKFDTPVGLEDNLSLDAWNVSRGLLFTLAEPTYHTGARATASLTDGLAVSAFWLNGWNTNVAGGNGMRSVGVATNISPTSKLTLSAVYLGGPERAPRKLASPDSSYRGVVSTYATYAVTSRVDLAATFDDVRDASGGGKTVWGCGLYGRVRFTAWLDAALRGEHYGDPDGFVTGHRQTLDEGTVTLEAAHTVGRLRLIAALEYRRDQSSQATLPGGQTHDDTVGVGLTAGF